MAAKKNRIQETITGSTLYNIDPIIMKWHYEIDYIHSYAQDSHFFSGLSEGKLFGSSCTKCPMVFATPRGYCMQCGAKTAWLELSPFGKIHTFTTCYFGGEAFLKETPFTLILVEFEDVDTLFLSRLVGAKPESVQIGLSVEAQFLRNSKFLATDVYFTLREKERIRGEKESIST